MPTGRADAATFKRQFTGAGDNNLRGFPALRTKPAPSEQA